MCYFMYKAITVDKTETITITLELFYLTWTIAMIGWAMATQKKCE